MKKIILLLTILTTVFIGCSSLIISNDPSLLLRERTNGLMQARMRGDWETAYHFFNEKYKKEKSIEPFKQKRSVKVLSYTIEKINILPSTSEAKVIVRSTIIINMKTLKILTTQKWIYENHNWYLFAKPLATPFG